MLYFEITALEMQRKILKILLEEMRKKLLSLNLKTQNIVQVALTFMHEETKTNTLFVTGGILRKVVRNL